MNNRELQRLYNKASNGNKQAQKELTKYLQKVSYNINRQLNRIIEQNIPSKESDRVIAFLQNTDIDTFPTTYAKLESTGMPESVLEQLDYYTRKGKSIREIKRDNRKTIQALRKHGWNIPKGSESQVIRIMYTDAFQLFVDLESEKGRELIENAIESGTTIQELNDRYNEYLNDTKKDLFDVFEPWVKI